MQDIILPVLTLLKPFSRRAEDAEVCRVTRRSLPCHRYISPPCTMTAHYDARLGATLKSGRYTLLGNFGQGVTAAT